MPSDQSPAPNTNAPRGGTLVKLVTVLAVLGVIIAVSLTNPKGSGKAGQLSPEHGSEGPSGKLAMPDAVAPPTRGLGESEPATAADQRVDPASIRFGEPQARRKAPGTVRVATFNVENLFDDKDDPKISGEIDDIKMTKPAAQLRAAGLVIAALDADVLTLQEIESLEALLWFRDNHLKGLGYEHVASLDAGDGRGIEQAVLSRFPLSEVRNEPKQKLGGQQPSAWGDRPNSNSGSPFQFTRAPLHVTVTVPTSSVQELLAKSGKTTPVARDYKLQLLVVHLKSGREFGAQRVAEAEALVNMVRAIEKADAKANVLVLGDFNATLNRDELVVFSRAGLPSIFQDREPRDAKTMTHTSGRCIDHIFFNDQAQPELLMDSKFVLGTAARALGADFRTTPAPAGYSSDHYPVAIDLRPIEAPR